MTTRYGQIQIANSESFSQHPNGFGISPYLQEKLVFLGQLEVYDQAAQVARTLLGLSIASSQIYRLTNHYGAAIEADLDQPVVIDQPPTGRSMCRTTTDALVYVQADGAMLLTDEGYKENKLSRIFEATALKQSPVEDRGGRIEVSLFTAHLGTAPDFTAKLRPHLDTYKPLGANRTGGPVGIYQRRSYLATPTHGYPLSAGNTGLRFLASDELRWAGRCSGLSDKKESA